MRGLLDRHLLTMAWAATGLLCTAILVATGGSIGWQESSLLLGVLATTATWLIGGAATAAALRSSPCISRRQAFWLTTSWLGAALVALGAAAGLAVWLAEVRIGNTSGPAFIGVVVGIGLGAAVGGVLTGWLAADPPQRGRSAARLGVAAFFGFTLAAYIAIIGLVTVGQLMKVRLGGLLGPTPALLLGCGIVGLVAGMIAGLSLELGLRSVGRDAG